MQHKKMSLLIWTTLKYTTLKKKKVGNYQKRLEKENSP